MKIYQPAGRPQVWSDSPNRTTKLFESMFDLTKPVQTRDGHPARIIAKDYLSQGCLARSVLALVKLQDREAIYSYWPDGLLDPNFESPRDLINVPAPTCVEQIKALVLAGHEVRIKHGNYFDDNFYQVTLQQEPPGESFRAYASTLEEAIAICGLR